MRRSRNEASEMIQMRASALQSSIFAATQLATGFPYFIPIAGRNVHPHVFFESLAYAIAIAAFLYLRSRRGDALSHPIRWATLAAAFVGGALGSKLLYLLEDPQLTWLHLHDPAYLMGGKTIVGGLLGGLVAVEAMKRYVGLYQPTGDLLAIPIALGIAVGRFGCFLTGLTDNTYGTPTSLPWGVNFGDGIRRHPTQLYEVLFLAALVPALFWILQAVSVSSKDDRSGAAVSRAKGPATIFRAGDVFKVFMVGYLGFRLFCDFIKPYQHVALGLGSIQWACALGLLYYARDGMRWASLSTKGDA